MTKSSARHETITSARRAGIAGTVAAAGIIALGGIVGYWRALPYPFIFDDGEIIAENPHIRRLWPLSYAMSAPAQSPASGRPIVSLSLAINYRLGGLNPWGYRAFNLAVHILAALVLFGVVRRTLRCPILANRFGSAATPLAGITAMLWLLHPLQTESVTYVTQRCESMMGLFYLLTLYCVIRGFASSAEGWAGPAVEALRGSPRNPAAEPMTSRPGGPSRAGGPARRKALVWYSLSVAACALGMASKEVMVTAPVLVLLYDRTFVAGTFVQALRRRRWFYVLLAATWVILAAVVAGNPRSASAGFGLAKLTAMDYAKSQFGVILHYLRLSFWPDSLCLDYAWPVAHGFGRIVPPMLVVLVLAAASVWALVRRPPLGYLGAWFLVILAPTSTIVPILDLAFEHRMYLPLAAECVLAVTGVYLLLQGLARREASWSPALRIGGLLAAATVVVAFGVRTAQRNGDYRSAMAMWTDVLSQRPENPRAHNNLAECLSTEGRIDEAIGHIREALRLRPDYGLAHNNMSVTLVLTGKGAEALRHSEEAVRLMPYWAGAYNQYGCALLACGEADDAVGAFLHAIQLEPDNADANYNLAAALLQLGRPDQATDHLRQAIESRPDYAEARNNLGSLLLGQGKNEEAIEQYAHALRLRPGWAEVHQNMGLALAACERLKEAAASYQRALEIKPLYPEAHYNLGNALFRLGRGDAAIDEYVEALRERPDYRDAHFNLATVLRSRGDAEGAAFHLDQAMKLALRQGEQLDQQGRFAEAAEIHAQAARMDPSSDEARYRLGQDLLALGAYSDAADAFREALQINPGRIDAQQALEATSQPDG